MKNALIGYVTAVFNDNNRLMKNLEKQGENRATIISRCFGHALTDMLDFIEDFKEDVQADEYIEDYSIYVRRIQELEEENKKLYEANRKFYIRSTESKDCNRCANSVTNSGVQELKNQLVEANESIKSLKENEKRITEIRIQEINKFKCSDAMWGSIYRENIERIKKLAGEK